jgi:hypothetical protein
MRHLRLAPSSAPVRRPTQIVIGYPGGTTPPLRVAPDGTVALHRTLRSDSFRIQVIAASFPTSTPLSERSVRAVGIGRVRGIGGLGRVSVPRTGSLPGGCDGPALTVGGRAIRLAIGGTLAAFDAGTPLRARSCGAPVALPGGPLTLRGRAGPLLVDLLALRSPAPDPVAVATGAGGGAVLRPGHAGVNGAVTGATVSAHGPSWLVLGQSYDTGWQATCDGRSLGSPVPLQGYANGWPLDHGCRRLSFTYGPDRLMSDADLVSGAAALAMLIGLAVLAVGRRRRRPGRAGEPETGPGGARRAALVRDQPALTLPRRWSAPRAVAAGIVASGVLGFVFALRAGAVLGPLMALALWRGVGELWLTRLAGGLLVIVVPAIYLIFPPANRGGFDANYAEVEIYAHFVAVLAVCALGLALVRVLADMRSQRRTRLERARA